MSRIAILGAGAWGTALAVSLARRNDHQLTLWSHAPDHAASLASTRENTRYLPGFTLPESIRIAASLEESVSENDLLVLVTPSQHLGLTLQRIAATLQPRHALISASKGLEEGTHRRMSEVMRTYTASPVAVLSGPTFAQEIAAGKPAAYVIASENAELAQQLQKDFSTETVRVYRSSDVIGVELGGALKNVIAIAAGITVGLNLGSNATAALMTRGIAEITRLAVACGGAPETLVGLAGMGDLVLTCTGPLSRNRSVGLELGRGRALPEILASLNGKVAEGVLCTASALALAQQHGVEMPITQQMNAILHQGRSPQQAIALLMSRPGGEE